MTTAMAWVAGHATRRACYYDHLTSQCGYSVHDSGTTEARVTQRPGDMVVNYASGCMRREPDTKRSAG
jgi:hypothetical protein